MSSGPFSIVSYQSDSGVVHPVRVQPETITETNPVGAARTSEQYFYATSSRRRFGSFARFITIGLKVGVVAEGGGPFAEAKVYAHIVVFTEDVYKLMKVGDDFVYQGKSFQIVTKHPERVK